MAKNKIKYLHIDDYEDYIDRLIKRKETFSVASTTYSRKVVTDNVTIIFNEDGGTDFNVLSLINAVRKNARDFLANTSIEKREEYIYFFDYFRKPQSDEVIWKIDVKSAYWIAALKKGVVDEMTNRKLLEAFEGKDAREMKRARLKALGSLATTSVTKRFINGVLQDINPVEDIYTQPTKEIYMDICRDVDMLMRDCVNENQTVIYYYWDCIFVPKNTAAPVLEFFKQRDYKVTVEETRLSFHEIQNNGGGYILSESDDKAYMVRKESIGLLDGI